MSVIRITKEFRFEGAHALQDYDGKCRHIHGHSYILYVTVKGRPVQDKNSCKNGMLMDFTDLKKIVNEHITDPFDHALILRSDAPFAEELCRAYQNVVLVDFQPTCENLISYFARTLRKYLPENAELFGLRLYETATSYVEWFADDNKRENGEAKNGEAKNGEAKNGEAKNDETKNDEAKNDEAKNDETEDNNE